MAAEAPVAGRPSLTDSVVATYLMLNSKDPTKSSILSHTIFHTQLPSCADNDGQCRDCHSVFISLTLERFSSVGRAPTSATEPSVQLDLESATISRRTSGSRTCGLVIQPCQTVAENVLMWSVEPKRTRNCALEITLLTYLLTY